MNDREILRRLAAEWADWAGRDAAEQRLERWRDLNDLRPSRPLLWINEIPWNEFDDDFLQVRCADPFLRGIELVMRRTLYSRRHFPGDMAIEPEFYVDLALEDSGFGLDIREEALVQGAGDISSHHYEPVIRTLRDVEKIQLPRLTLDRAATERRLELMNGICGDLVRIVPGGVPTI